MSESKTNILLVEDDESLGFLIKDNLTSNKWNIQLYADGEKGLTAFRNFSFDLCILDVMLPKKDGFTLAAEVRHINPQVPIVFLTAKNMTEDKIKGFQVGADDYVTKPFSIEEFKYRIDAILKRANGKQAMQDNCITFKDNVLDPHNLILTCHDHAIQLTHKECKILQLFFHHPNELIERNVFLKNVWEDEGFFVARSMDVFISRLRKYLQHDPDIRIENVRGVGYVMKG